MPKKRRNGGRSRKGRGKTRQVDCSHCNCKPPKDKAIKRFIVRNIVDSGALNDIKAACAYEVYTQPKFYTKNYYCVSCAVHSRVVRVRNRIARRNRDPPPRFRRTERPNNNNNSSSNNKAAAPGAAAAAAPKPAA